MSKPKVLVTRKWPTEVETELKEKYDVTLNENDVALTIPELKSAFQNYDCVCPTVTDPINEEVLSVENKKAKIIASFGVGFNHIDLDAAKKENLSLDEICKKWKETIPLRRFAQPSEIASVVGRYYAMDRDKRWERIEVGLNALCVGDGEESTDPVKTIKERYEMVF